MQDVTSHAMQDVTSRSSSSRYDDDDDDEFTCMFNIAFQQYFSDIKKGEAW